MGSPEVGGNCFYFVIPFLGARLMEHGIWRRGIRCRERDKLIEREVESKGGGLVSWLGLAVDR